MVTLTCPPPSAVQSAWAVTVCVPLGTLIATTLAPDGPLKVNWVEATT